MSEIHHLSFNSIWNYLTLPDDVHHDRSHQPINSQQDIAAHHPYKSSEAIHCIEQRYYLERRWF